MKIWVAPGPYNGGMMGVVRDRIPSVEMAPDPQGSWQLSSETIQTPAGIWIGVFLLSPEGQTWEESVLEKEDLDNQAMDLRLLDHVRTLTYRVINQAFSLPKSPWGVLTGQRPGRLFAELCRGLSPTGAQEKMVELYDLRPEKAALLAQVARAQAPMRGRLSPRGISIYLGVPFCPTRCGYCSFAAYPMHSHGHLLAGYLQGLREEVNWACQWLKDEQISIDSVYIGGGTPTVLTPQDLLEVLGPLRALSGQAEWTVEAGRPETLTPPMVQALTQLQVDRISINPQTMQETTLRRIGREHTVDDVYQAYALARQAGIPLINTDLILGLPGEGEREVGETLNALEGLAPENLTIHPLAQKRASEWGMGQWQMDHERAGQIMEMVVAWLAHRGYFPYYLYRQRRILGDLENTGWTRLGGENLYNVIMMEEWQTVLGLGAGAMTRMVDGEGRVSRLGNPKCPSSYLHGLNERWRGKTEVLTKLYN